MPGCTHDGFHSGAGRYDAVTQTLRYVVTCDACGAELREVTVERYRPVFDPHGNDVHVTGAAA
jgi:hypothetical protein